MRTQETRTIYLVFVVCSQLVFSNGAAAENTLQWLERQENLCIKATQNKNPGTEWKLARSACGCTLTGLAATISLERKNDPTGPWARLGDMFDGGRLLETENNAPAEIRAKISYRYKICFGTRSLRIP